MLISTLQDDFPDVSISKVRFLETEGLVTPARTPSGYRKYSPEDVQRLRFILAAQRDRFWPLKVIRERLDAVDRGLDLGEDGVVVPPAGDVPEGGRLSGVSAARSLRLTSLELQQAADIDTGTFRDLVSYGLLPKDREHFDGADLEVARASGALVAAGIDVRHLRPFRNAAERELALAEHVLGQQGLRGRAADAQEVDDESVKKQVLEDCLALHVALVRKGMEPGPRSTGTVGG